MCSSCLLRMCTVTIKPALVLLCNNIMHTFFVTSPPLLKLNAWAHAITSAVFLVSRMINHTDGTEKSCGTQSQDIFKNIFKMGEKKPQHNVVHSSLDFAFFKEGEASVPWLAWFPPQCLPHCLLSQSYYHSLICILCAIISPVVIWKLVVPPPLQVCTSLWSSTVTANSFFENCYDVTLCTDSLTWLICRASWNQSGTGF